MVASLDDGQGELSDESVSSVYVRVFNHSSEPVWEVKIPVPGRELKPLLYERIDPHGSVLNGWRDAPEDWYLRECGFKGVSGLIR